MNTELVKRWRALKLPGRLYWRRRVHWRDWESGAVACYREGTARTWYYTMEALRADIADMEALRQEQAHEA